MSSRKRKRTSDEEDGEMGLQEKRGNFEEGEGGVSSARSGRVRKKSAKVLEMEEAEELEKQFSKSSTSKKQKNAPAQVTFLHEQQPNLEYPTSPEKDPLKLKFHLGSLQASPPNPPPTQIQDAQGGIKLKLMLSPTKDQEVAATSPSKLPLTQNKVAKKKKATLQSPTLSSPIQMDIPTKNDKSKRKKLKKKNDDDIDIKEETKSAPELLAALTNAPTSSPQMMMETVTDTPLIIDTPKAKKTSPKKKSSSKKRITESEEDVTTSPENHTSADSNPVYSDTQQMALKLKTSQERKASKGNKKKKSKLKQEETGPPKKKRSPTAYMLWCSSMRTKVVLQNPGIDFATISKRLGEIWHSLPEKEKLGWKRKAKKNAAKGSTLISTGKGMKKTAQLAKPSPHLAKTGGKVAAVQSKIATEEVAVTPCKVMATCPIDVAAHLKLLGESLSIIGARLQEHQGQIAVQGTLPVLLDSLLCALGPLMCLTNTLPETNGCPVEVHSKTLDNVAYIMPVG